MVWVSVGFELVGFDFDVSVAVYGSEVCRLPMRGGERESADDVDNGGGYVFEISAWVGGVCVLAVVCGSCLV